MVDRELLSDLGFVLGRGWDHEVWVYDGRLWVHFGRTTTPLFYCSDRNIDAENITRKNFLERFVSMIIGDLEEDHVAEIFSIENPNDYYD